MLQMQRLQKAAENKRGKEKAAIRMAGGHKIIIWSAGSGQKEIVGLCRAALPPTELQEDGQEDVRLQGF